MCDARDEAHSARLGRVRVDRKAGLYVRAGEIAIGGRRPAEAAVLVPGEVAERSRRLPVHLVDDLLEVATDQRLEQIREPPSSRTRSSTGW